MKEPVFFDTDTRPLYIISGIFFVIAIALSVWFFLTKPEEKNSAQATPVVVEEKKEPINCLLRQAWSGTCVAETEKQYEPLVAVMIENHSEARPQSGLADAAVVYEAPVEANYSRFMALFPVFAGIEKVGPVRSARPYYLSWLQEYGEPMYLHVGGSPDAIEKIDADNIFDMNEFYRGWYFWRANDRFAPHSTYTSSKLWQKAYTDYGKNKLYTDYGSWQFDDESLSVCTDNCASGITVTFLAPTYQAVWKYHTSTHTYERYQSGEPHVDQNGKIIAADTVIVQRVKTKVFDEVGRIHMDTIGTGKVLVFRDGRVVEGSWLKETKKTRTRFVDKNGIDIPLRSGKIWIEVVNQVGNVMYQ